MKWQEKIRRLLRGKNASELARSVGLHVSAIGDAAKKGQMPKADKAVRIARALGIPCDWLFDDSLDWPPPAKAAAALLSDMELVEELARRRDLIIQDMTALLRKLPWRRLKRWNRLAAKTKRTQAEEAELAAAVRQLVLAKSFSNKLTWCDPDDVYPPARRPEPICVLIMDLEHLRRCFEEAQDGARVLQDARVAGSMEHFAPNDGSVPRHPGIPSLVSRHYLADGDDSTLEDTADFVPLLLDASDAPPVRGKDGFYPEDIASDFIHWETADPHAFACRVAAYSEVPGYPPGSIVVCEPSRELSAEDACAVPSPHHCGTVDIVKGADILTANPRFRSAPVRLEQAVKVFPVARVFPTREPTWYTDETRASIEQSANLQPKSKHTNKAKKDGKR